MLTLTPPVHAADEPAVQLTNRWHLDGSVVFLTKNQTGDGVDFGPAAGDERRSAWQVIPDGQGVRIKDAFSGKFLHQENGKLELSPVQPDAMGASWAIEPVPHELYFRLRNRKTNGYLHRENGVMEASPIGPGAWSSWWAKEYIARLFPGLEEQVRAIPEGALDPPRYQSLFTVPATAQPLRDKPGQNLKGVALTVTGRYAATRLVEPDREGVLYWTLPRAANKSASPNGERLYAMASTRDLPGALQAYGDVLAVTQRRTNTAHKLVSDVQFYRLLEDNRYYRVHWLRLARFAPESDLIHFHGLGFSRLPNGHYYLLAHEPPAKGLASALRLYQLQIKRGEAWVPAYSLYEQGSRWENIPLTSGLTGADALNLIPKSATEFWVVTFRTKQRDGQPAAEISVATLDVSDPKTARLQRNIPAQNLGTFRGLATQQRSPHWWAGIGHTGENLRLFWASAQPRPDRLEIASLPLSSPAKAETETAGPAPIRVKLRSGHAKQFLAVSKEARKGSAVYANGDADGALAFEVVAVGGGVKFRVPGTHLFLGYRDMTSVAELTDRSEGAVFRQRKRSDGQWDLINTRKDQYLWVNGETPYVTSAGEKKEAERGWELVETGPGKEAP